MKARTILICLISFLFTANGWTKDEQPDSVAYPGYEMLEDLEVTAQKPVVQTDGAKLTYNVEEDPAAVSSNALEILKKVPQISVDGDGNVLLNGSSAFKFQVNGLDNPLLKQYPKQILEGMPASLIVKIEVITEPGAKEDAEGVSGIINIITERSVPKGEVGYAGTASLRVDNKALTPSLYGLLKKDNFIISANLNYQWGFYPQKYENESTTTYLRQDNGGKMINTTGQQNRHHYFGGNLNMSWEPNKNNLFTAGFDFVYLTANINRIYGSSIFTDLSSNLSWSFRQNGHGMLDMTTLSANASYRHNFGYNGNYLVVSYLFNYGINDLSLMREYYDFVNYPIQNFQETLFEKDSSKTFNRGHTVQADYANDFHSEHHLMEIGAKGIFRHNNAISDYEFGKTKNELVGMPDMAGNILQPQNIYAAYGQYTGSFSKFGVVGGIRYEHSYMGITNKLPDSGSSATEQMRNFRNRLNDWVPNGAISWNFTPSSNLRLSYQMRISRPSIEQVNPFALYISPYEVKQGNSDLTSEKSHIVALKYSGFGRIFGGSIGVQYTLNNNAISGITFIEDYEGINRVVDSYANIGKRQQWSVNGYLSWGITTGMNLSLNGRLAYDCLNSPSMGIKNHGWSGNIGGSWSYNVADIYHFAAYGNWVSRSLKLQGYGSGFYYYGLSASRDCLADKSLTIGLSATNFFQNKMKYVDHSATPNIIQDSAGVNLQTWNVALSISWKFGKLNTQVKHTGVEVENDDINRSSNKSQGGGL